MFSAPRFIVYDFRNEEPAAVDTSIPSAPSELKNDFKFDQQSYVYSDVALSASENQLATKIFSVIQRDSIQFLKPADQIFERYLAQRLASITSMDLSSFIKAVVLLSDPIVILHFSKTHQTTQAKVLKSEDQTVVCLQTYGLDQIATQPHLKAEFWHFLKELKN